MSKNSISIHVYSLFYKSTLSLLEQLNWAPKQPILLTKAHCSTSGFWGWEASRAKPPSAFCPQAAERLMVHLCEVEWWVVGNTFPLFGLLCPATCGVSEGGRRSVPLQQSCTCSQEEGWIYLKLHNFKQTWKESLSWWFKHLSLVVRKYSIKTNFLKGFLGHSLTSQSCFLLC